MRDIVVEIQGEAKHGYHLIMMPEGLFAADAHCRTLEDAFEDAHEMFGITPEQWQQVISPLSDHTTPGQPEG
jgi:hypothetical protein